MLKERKTRTNKLSNSNHGI